MRATRGGSRRAWSWTGVAAAVALLAGGAGSGVAQDTAPAGRGPERVYTIAMSATYDPGERSIAGTERLRWRNTSSVPVGELQLHLYLNAFASTRTTFFRESGGQLRGVKIPPETWGFIEVTAMRTAAGDDLKAVEQFISPDDGNPDDRTVARYPLPAPLPPGESIEVEIEFTGRMPGVFARNGAHGDYVLGGQWFPKVAVFEDAGVRGRAEAGWNCHQYHAHSEFYADFGDYDVSITLPLRYRGHIGGTGRLVEETATADTVTVRFVQEGVNDFAWTADPAFVVVRDRFDPLTDVSAVEQGRIAGLLGLTPEEIALLPVDITLLVRPENRSQAVRYISSLKVGLAGYGLRLGAYPYPHFTLVDPPRGAMGSAGMEYVTFITLGTHPLLGMWPLDEVRAAEMVTIHEFGHNYWMGMIASNEFEESWLDEGINSYYDMIVTDEAYGAQVEVLGLEATAFDDNHASLRGGRYTDPIVRESWRFRTGGSYGFNSYARPAVTLRHLENLVGTSAFHKAMRAFFQEWQFRHPSTADFERSFQAGVGRDLTWFFEQAFHSTRALDYGVRTVTSSKVRKVRGFVWRDGVRTLEGDGKDDDKDEGAGNEDYRAVVVVDRLGEFVHPVTVELRWADGHVERREWDGQERWVRWEVVRGAELVAAEVDPDGLLALDVNRLNNGRLLEERSAPANKLLVHMLFWLQNLLAATALVG